MILVVILGVDFPVVELSGVEIVLESLEDCVCLSDTVRSLYFVISSCDLLAKPDFKGKSVLLVAFLEEYSGVSTILQELHEIQHSYKSSSHPVLFYIQN